MIEFHAHGLWEVALTSISTGLILAHNLWLVAKDEGTSKDQELRVEINTGHHFPVSTSAVNPARVDDLRLISLTGSQPITNYRVEGESLVAQVAAQQMNCALVVALVLHPHPITLEAKKFVHYIDDEDAHDAVAAQLQETSRPQREIYTKFAKAIVTAGADGDNTYRRVVNHKLEIIPELDPATLSKGSQLPVQVIFDGRPLAGVRVSSGCEQLQGEGYAAHARTREDGQATIEITASGRWFIRTHYIRPHHDLHIADWESFWSSLTFEVNA